MRMTKTVLGLALGLVAGGAGAALADRPGTDWMPMEQVIQGLKRSGYTVIGAMEADNGRWEGEGLKGGQWMDFHADARTGAILHEKPDN